eukprot:TRINITY_DN7562_c1_g1_i7.p1 TRINITY_DN7562_c1_g1~~TRINITY_DN7562_c1_g1_i7.p1  ORF type:complete len:113 (-),score=24.12 TRINITY_DN7562_c1_g1_i7:296-634(-)
MISVAMASLLAICRICIRSVSSLLVRIRSPPPVILVIFLLYSFVYPTTTFQSFHFPPLPLPLPLSLSLSEEEEKEGEEVNPFSEAFGSRVPGAGMSKKGAYLKMLLAVLNGL